MLELDRALKDCKNGAPGDDGIHYSVIRNLSPNAKTEFLNLFNKSWKTGKTPESWHEAIIIPLLKSNKPKTDPASYRPISLTSTFAKLMQKIIKPKLCSYLEKNNLISKYQSGCRQGHSCDDNLTRLETDIRRTQKSKHFLIAVFLDLSAAFDKLWNAGAVLI